MINSSQAVDPDASHSRTEQLHNSAIESVDMNMSRIPEEHKDGALHQIGETIAAYTNNEISREQARFANASHFSQVAAGREGLLESPGKSIPEEIEEENQSPYRAPPDIMINSSLLQGADDQPDIG